MFYDPPFDAIVEAAADRLTAVLKRETPSLGSRVLPWLGELSRTGRLVDYFTNPRRFPILLLPWWAVEDTPSRDDRQFHEDVALSTMSGYCYIRLLDDLMDRRGVPGLDLLPAAGVFHLEFQSAYQRHFAPDSPFWDTFRTRWLQGADATHAPATIDAAGLEARAEANLGPALIPITAACLHAGVPERIERWRPVILELARLEQFLDDVVDWQDDHERGQPNLLLAEWTAKAPSGEPALSWVVREGYVWGLETARARLSAAVGLVEPLGSQGLLRYLADRTSLVDELTRETGPGLRQLAELARVFGSAIG